MRRWNVSQIISDLARAENLDEEIRKEALRRIAEAEESLMRQEN